MYHIDLKHDGLRRCRRLSGTDKYILAQRARVQTEAWDEHWCRRAVLDHHSDELLRHLPNFQAQKAHAARLTNEAQRVVTSLRNILARGLKAAPFKMVMLYDHSIFPELRPVPPVDQELPREPLRSDPLFTVVEEYDVVAEFWALWLPKVRRKLDLAAQAKHEAAQARFELAHRSWQEATYEIDRLNAKAAALFEIGLEDWWTGAQTYQKQQQDENAQIDKFRLRYANGERNAVTEFLDATLSHSEYPDLFPMQWEMNFAPETGAVVVDYELPSPEDFPRLMAVKYDILLDNFTQNYCGASEIAHLYDDAIYQTCLRSLHDLFAADEADVVTTVTFNGWVNFTDKVHGKPARACIVSVRADKATFTQTDLSGIDPKSYFRELNGVAGAKLAEMIPIVPILSLKGTDERFVPANDVVESDILGRPLARPDLHDHP
jgi:restriction system protein